MRMTEHVRGMPAEEIDVVEPPNRELRISRRLRKHSRQNEQKHCQPKSRPHQLLAQKSHHPSLP
jgi:hypothetical protein